jgi:S1-C subfamily serine protease
MTPLPGASTRSRLWPGVAALVVIIAVAALIAILSTRPLPRPATAAETTGPAHFSLALASPSVLTLHCYDQDGELTAQGSGFVVRRSGIAVTNWHVAEHATTMTATNGSGRVFKVSGYVNVDAGADLVLLQLANQDGSPVANLPELHFADSRTVATGQKIFTLSTPLGLSQTLTDGLVSAIRSFRQQQYLQISAPVSHGSSGGPVFNESGEVIGVIKGLVASGENLNFAIPIDSVVRLLSAPATVVDQGVSGSTVTAFVPERAAPPAAAGDDIVMARNSSVYHRADCPLLAGLHVTHFKRAQIGSSWATPCTTCRPNE